MDKFERKSPNFGAKSATFFLIAMGLLLLLAALLFDAYGPGPALAQANPASSKGHPDEQEAGWWGRDLYWANRRGLQFGVPRTAYRAATEQMHRMEAATSALKAGGMALPAITAPPFFWNFIGPLPILNNLPNFGGLITGAPLANSQGRVTVVAADPSTPGRFFVGTAGGGVWMTADAGNSFVPIFDGQPSLAIAAIAIDPRTDPVTIFVATGEGNGSDSFYGQGIFKSGNLGASWTQLVPGVFDRVAFSRLAIDSNNPPHLFAAVTGADSLNRGGSEFTETNPANVGLWRSEDDGATWTQYPLSTFDCLKGTNPCPAVDVAVDPNNSKNVYVAIVTDDVYRSTDGGDSWEAMTFPGVLSGPRHMGRQSIAVSASSPGTVYAMLGSISGDDYVGFFRSSDSGENWTAAAVPAVNLATASLDGTSGFSQSSYDQALAILPGSSAKLYFGGVGPYISTDSGETWRFIAGSVGATAPSTHADQHAVAVDPFNSDFLFLGNDGGFYSYQISKGIWTALSFGFSAGQIEGIGPHPWENTKLVAGFQDNGTQLYSGSQGWPNAGGTELAGGGTETGDGGFALFDQLDPNYVYHTFASGTDLGASFPNLSTSTNGGAAWNTGGTETIGAVMKAAKDAGASFYPPLAVDPAVRYRVMLGAQGVYVSTDAMFTWQQQTSQVVTGGCNSPACALNDLEFASSDHSHAWSLSAQTNFKTPPTPFKVFNTVQANLDSGAAWNDVTANLPLNPATAQGSSIVPDPNNSEDAYLSVSGFTAVTGVGHVFRTTDFGTTWAREDGFGGTAPLPDVPVIKMLVDRRDVTGNTVLAGTDIGIFSSSDGGGAWAPYNLANIPKVPVIDLEQNFNGLIFAGTHGRGAYQLLPNAAFTAGTFQFTGSMTVSHDSAITLSDGRVLVSQGADLTTFIPFNTTEFYNASTGSFSAGPDFVNTSDSPHATRDGATTILLTDGRVLFAGGLTEDPMTFINTVLQSSELYDPEGDKFVVTGEM
jgi:hypothetical protein